MEIAREDLRLVYADLIAEHRSWFGAFDQERAKKWEGLLEANAEAAICEAATRSLLRAQGNDVEPWEDPSHGGPDYRCTSNGVVFFVEVTCITRERITKKSRIAERPFKGIPYFNEGYDLVTDAIFSECCRKTPQCSNLSAPCILAVGTLHSEGPQYVFNRDGAAELLTGTTLFQIRLGSETGATRNGTGLVSDLQSAAFVRYAKGESASLEFARSPISGVLLCGFGSRPQVLSGILHPNPNHSFDRTLLPGIRFCRLADGYETGMFRVEWV